MHTLRKLSLISAFRLEALDQSWPTGLGVATSLFSSLWPCPAAVGAGFEGHVWVDTPHKRKVGRETIRGQYLGREVEKDQDLQAPRHWQDYTSLPPCATNRTLLDISENRILGKFTNADLCSSSSLSVRWQRVAGSV